MKIAHIKAKRQPFGCLFALVRVAGFEPTASWSRTMRATNCATPGDGILPIPLAKREYYYSHVMGKCQEDLRPQSSQHHRTGEKIQALRFRCVKAKAEQIGSAALKLKKPLNLR